MAETVPVADFPTGKPGHEEEQNASTRFSEHVAQPQSFARKFGHYKQHMADTNTSEEGSSTGGDDSQRARALAGEDWSGHREADWQVSV